MRIRSRIIGAVLTVFAIGNVIYAGYFLDKERRNARERLERTITDTNRLLGSVLSAPLDRGDVHHLENDLDAIFQNQEIVRLTLTARRSDIALSRERTPPNGNGELMDYQVKIVRAANELGEIDVVYSTAAIDERL